MSDSFLTFPNSPSNDLLRRVVALSEQLEAEWKAGRRRTLEQLLDNEPEADRPFLLVMLLQLELELRRQAGESPKPSEYAERFPDCTAAIAAAFAGDGASEDTPTANCWRPSANVTPFQFGHLIGGYELLEKLGQGGMGVVYRARQLKAGRIVALKCIRPDYLDALPSKQREEAVARFLAEARAAATLQDKHLVTVYEVGEEAGLLFYSMRYVDGESLSTMLRSGPLTNERAAELLEPVARAVHHAHQHGILHRDLKPANILLDRLGQPYVTDFGLAKRLEPMQMLAAPSRAELGTPSYMSPEQARGEEAIGGRSDVYSLGATLYQMLTGRPPFQAATVVETFRQLLDQDPVPPRKLNPDVARDLESICLKCLEKEPARRYASAAALADDVRRYRNGVPVRARRASPWRHSAKWARKRPAITALALICAWLFVAMIGVGLWYSNRQVELEKKREADERDASAGIEQARRDEAKEREFAALRHYFGCKNEAKALILDKPMGWRGKALAELEQACRFKPNNDDLVELRSLIAECLNELDLHEVAAVAKGGKASALAFDPQGRFLAVAHSFGYASACTLILVDLKDGNRERRVSIPTSLLASVSNKRADRVQSLTFSPDGRWLVAAMRLGQLHRWDLSTNSPSHSSWDAQAGDIDQITFSPDSQTLYTMAADQMLRAWRMSDLAQVTQAPYQGKVISLAVHPTEGWLTYSAVGHGINFLNGDTLQPLRPPLKPTGSLRFVYFPSGEEYLEQSGDTARVCGIYAARNKFDLVDGRNTNTHDEEIKDMAVSPNGALMVTSSEWLREVKLWEYAGKRPILTWSVDGGISPVIPAFRADGKMLAVNDALQTHLYTVDESPALRVAVRETDTVTAFDISPDGQEIAVLSRGERYDGRVNVRIWRQGDGEQFDHQRLHVVRPRAGGIEPSWLSFNPDGTAFAFSNRVPKTDWRALVCDATNGLDRFHSTGNQPIRGGHFGPDNRIWQVEDGSIDVWDERCEKSKVKRWVFANSYPLVVTPQVRCVAPGRSLAVVGGRDGSAIMLDAASVTAKRRVIVGDAVIGSVALSPDETKAVVGTDGGELAVIAMPDGPVTNKKKVHDGRVTALAFGSNHLIASGSSASEIRLWSCENDQLRQLFQVTAPGPIVSLKFFPDGKRLAILLKNERAVRVLDLGRLRSQFDAFGLGADLRVLAGQDVPNVMPQRRWPLPEPATENPSAAHGLKEEVFVNHDWTWLVRSGYQHQPLFFNSLVPSMAGQAPGEQYSIRWTGWLKAPRPGRYVLKVDHDDSARIWIDDRLVCDFRQSGAFQFEVDLTGRPQPIRIDYRHLIGEAHFKLSWFLKGEFAEGPLPVEALFHSRADADKAVVSLPRAWYCYLPWFCP